MKITDALSILLSVVMTLFNMRVWYVIGRNDGKRKQQGENDDQYTKVIKLVRGFVNTINLHETRIKELEYEKNLMVDLKK